MTTRYSPTMQSPLPAVYWRPGAMALPAVGYPSTPKPSAPVTGQRTRTVSVAAPRPIPEQVFGVNVNSGGWPVGSMPRGYNEAGPLNPSIYKNHTVNMGGGGGGGSDLSSSFREMLDRANQANEARYQDVLGGYQSRYERGMDMLKGMGQQEAKDISELADNQAALTRQRLTDRGLANSTVLDTMLSGVDREQAANIGRLYDRVRQQALQTDAGLSGDTLQFMERKDETGPDTNLLAQLAMAMGRGGYGGGGGGFVGGGGGMGMASADPYLSALGNVMGRAQGVRNLNSAMAMGGMGSSFGNIRNANSNFPNWVF